ncbi:MAG: hypothetical protein U1E98_02750 [Moraxella osloensis]
MPKDELLKVIGAEDLRLLAFEQDDNGDYIRAEMLEKLLRCWRLSLAARFCPLCPMTHVLCKGIAITRMGTPFDLISLLGLIVINKTIANGKQAIKKSPVHNHDFKKAPRLLSILTNQYF